MNIRVFLADDHPVVRDGLRLSIERSGCPVSIVGEASDGLELLRRAGRCAPDVFIVDIAMPGKNGIEATRELLEKRPDARVIMLSLHDTKGMVETALAAGACGYLTKENASRCVVEAVTTVHAGRRYLCSKAARWLRAGGAARRKPGERTGAAPQPSARMQALTRQQRRVLEFIADGRSNKEMAALLGVSVHTIHTHRNHLMAKLGIHRQAGLVRFAIHAGLTPLD